MPRGASPAPAAAGPEYHGAKVGDQVTLAIGPGGSPVKGYIVGVKDGIPKVRLAEAIPGNTAYPAGSHTFPEPEELTHIAGKAVGAEGTVTGFRPMTDPGWGWVKPGAGASPAPALTHGHLKVGDTVKTKKGAEGTVTGFDYSKNGLRFKDKDGKSTWVTLAGVTHVNGMEAGKFAGLLGEIGEGPKGATVGQAEKPKVALKVGKKPDHQDAAKSALERYGWKVEVSDDSGKVYRHPDHPGSYLQVFRDGSFKHVMAGGHTFHGAERGTDGTEELTHYLSGYHGTAGKKAGVWEHRPDIALAKNAKEVAKAPGYVLGGLAVHRELKDGKPDASGKWVVTHTGTGANLPGKGSAKRRPP